MYLEVYLAVPIDTSASLRARGAQELKHPEDGIEHVEGRACWYSIHVPCCRRHCSLTILFTRPECSPQVTHRVLVARFLTSATGSDHIVCARPLSLASNRSRIPPPWAGHTISVFFYLVTRDDCTARGGPGVLNVGQHSGIRC